MARECHIIFLEPKIHAEDRKLEPSRGKIRNAGIQARDGSTMESRGGSVIFYCIRQNYCVFERAFPWDDVGTERLTGILEGSSTSGTRLVPEARTPTFG